MSRATLKPIISKLREIIIKDIAGKMEKYGFNDIGIILVNKPLSDYDTVIKNNVLNVFDGRNIGGNKEGFIKYVQDTARTFLHILVSFKSMEKRKLIGKVLEGLLDSGNYDAILPDFNTIPPLAFSDLLDKYKDKIAEIEKRDNYEDDTDYYSFIFILEQLSKQMAKEVPLLFRDYEHTLVHPDFEGIKEILFNLSKIDEAEFYEDDFLGWIYQYWVDVKEDEIKAAKSNVGIGYRENLFYEILKSLEEEQTQYGEFYTPRWVVKYIVDNTLKPYFEENQKIETIKLLDPACGAGNFLVYSFDVFYELYKKEHPDWNDNLIITNILEKNIFGVDIQREPLQITALNLWLKAKKKAVDCKVRTFNLFNMNILKANSLYRWEKDSDENMQLSLFNTELKLTEKKYTAEDIGKYISAQSCRARRDARAFFKNKFNVIVMNPPYSGLRKLNEETAKFLKTNYPRNYHNLFEAFVERATELIIKNGYVGFISSDSFLTLESHTNLRTLLLKETHIHWIVNLGGGVFEGPAVKSAILIFSYNKCKDNISHALNALNWKTAENPDEYIKDEKIYIFNQSEFVKITLYPFLYDVPTSLREKMVKIKPLETFVEIKQGMITGDNERFLKLKWEIPQEQIGVSWFKYAKGGGFSKYANNIFDHIFWADDGQEIKALAKKKYGSTTRTVKNQNYFFREGITYSDITSENIFSGRYMPSGCIFDVKGSCIFSDTINNSYILGFVNSKFTNYILKKLNPSPSFQVCDMFRIPFEISKKEYEQLVIEKTLKAKEIKEIMLGFNYVSDFYHEVELAYGFSHGAKSVTEAYQVFINKYNVLETELYNLQIEIDEIVYKIYELDREDIAVIEEEFPNTPTKLSKNNEIKKVTLNFIRAITKDILIKAPAKLYEDTEIEMLIKQYIEKKFENGYKITEEIESILEKQIIDVIRGGIKIGAKNITLAGCGSKDLDEPLLQQKVLSGTGNNKNLVIWHLTHFLLEFEENQKYVMQNEIRRIKELYTKRLETVKGKILSGNTNTEMEKQEKLLSESIKTLENWKVV